MSVKVVVSVLVVMALGSLAACTKANDEVCDANRSCPNPDHPFCDLDGSINGSPNSCISVECEPGKFKACSEDGLTAWTCSADGSTYDNITCDPALACDPLAGGCKTCRAGDTRCASDGTGIETCDDHGAWAHSTGCSNGCENATCLPCEEGMLSCGDDGNVDKCDAHGVPQHDHDCPFGCLAGACKACQENATSCDPTGTSVQTCQADGTEVITENCLPNGCYNGACKTCLAGTETCDSSGQNLDVCNAQGMVVFETACPNGCFNNACKTCAEGSLRCSTGGNLEVCTNMGTWVADSTCAAGCKTDSATAAHCKYLSPQFIPNACDTPATADLTVNTAVTFDTTNPTTCNGGTIAQTSPDPGICVVHFRNITITSTGSITTKTGTNPTDVVPSLALVADETLTIAGAVDVGAKGSLNGPGGGATVTGAGTGAHPLGSGGTIVVGSGAGAFKVGGEGCDTSTSPTTYTVGGVAQSTHPINQTSLHGGSSAGGGGGGGGGAVTVVACRGALNVSGTINAGGGGGHGGYKSGTDVLFPIGGGAGGTIILQGLSVSLTGSLFTHGGGGGGGGGGGTTTGTDGQDGSTTTATPPLGGTSTGGGGRMGGIGGFGSSVPGVSNGCTVSGVTYPGAGGGSQGFLGIVSGTTTTNTPTFTSPNNGTSMVVTDTKTGTLR